MHQATWTWLRPCKQGLIVDSVWTYRQAAACWHFHTLATALRSMHAHAVLLTYVIWARAVDDDVVVKHSRDVWPRLYKTVASAPHARTVRPRLACMPGARDRHGGRSRQAVHAYACVCVWPVVHCTTAVRPCFKWFRYRNTFVYSCQKYYSIMN